ncbi:DUF2917 domain-containing protein [bacterium]|nr:DUF2917 domain-containing protein [bacterium]
MDYQLSNNEMLILDGYSAGISIQCEKGVLWITQAGDINDHIIKTGESYQIENSGKVAIIGRSQKSILKLTGESGKGTLLTKYTN